MKLSQSIAGTVALASVAFAGNAFGAFSTLIPFTDFNSYTTGSLSGQGGWALYGGTTANYTIQSAITANPTGKALAINQTAGTTSAAYSRDAVKAFTATSWTNRTAGCNTAVFTWDMYVPTGGTSTNTMGAEIQDINYYSLGGIYIRPSDGQVFIRGKVLSTGSASNYSITGSFVTLGAWNTYSVAYDSVTKVSRLSWTDKTAGNVYSDLTLYSTYTPTEIDLNAVTYSTTTVANTVYYDNVSVYATVPSPGAVALIGLAGLVGRRRREGNKRA